MDETLAVEFFPLQLKLADVFSASRMTMQYSTIAETYKIILITYLTETVVQSASFGEIL